MSNNLTLIHDENRFKLNILCFRKIETTWNWKAILKKFLTALSMITIYLQHYIVHVKEILIEQNRINTMQKLPHYLMLIKVEARWCVIAKLYRPIFQQVTNTILERRWRLQTKKSSFPYIFNVSNFSSVQTRQNVIIWIKLRAKCNSNSWWATDNLSKI